MIYTIFILLACASVTLQAPNKEFSREVRDSKHHSFFRFSVNHTCFAIRKGNFPAIQRCLDCFAENMPEGDEDVKEVPPEAKKCLTNLPQIFKPCVDEDPTTVDCLQTAYRKHMRRIVRIFWSTYVRHFNESQRGSIIQLIAWAKLLFNIDRKSSDDYNTINNTVTPCREELKNKLIESRRRRDANEEEEEEPEVQDGTEIQEEEDEDMDEVARMKKHIDFLTDYLKCKFEAIKADDASLTIVKNAIKEYHYTIPALLVNTLYE